MTDITAIDALVIAAEEARGPNGAARMLTKLNDLGFVVVKSGEPPIDAMIDWRKRVLNRDAEPSPRVGDE